MVNLSKQVYIDKKNFIRIFENNWTRYKRLSKYRKVEDENVERLLKCGDPKNGFIQLRCLSYGETKIIPFSCKSRLCPSKLEQDSFLHTQYFFEVTGLA